MEHTRDEVWGYSEHSLKTEGLLEELGLLWQCPVLGTQLDTESRRDRGRKKC